MTAEGNGSSDEGPISQDWKSVRVKASRQPAAIFEIEDQSRLPPQPGGRNGAGNRGRRRRSLCPDRGRLESWRARGRGADWLGGRQGRNPARGKGRRRADPLARVGCSAPRLPRLRRHQGRLWKQTWASPPALARSRYLSASRFPPWFIPPIAGGAGGGGGGGGGGVTALGRGWGWMREWGNGRRRDLWQGEAPSGFSGQVRGRWLGVGSRRAGRQSSRAETGPEQPSIQGRKELPKSASACSRRPAWGGGADPALRGSRGTASRPAGIHRLESSSRVLGLRLRGLFLHRQERSPGPSPRRRIHCLPRNRGEVIWQQMQEGVVFAF